MNELRIVGSENRESCNIAGASLSDEETACRSFSRKLNQTWSRRKPHSVFADCKQIDSAGIGSIVSLHVQELQMAPGPSNRPPYRAEYTYVLEPQPHRSVSLLYRDRIAVERYGRTRHGCDTVRRFS